MRSLFTTQKQAFTACKGDKAIFLKQVFVLNRGFPIFFGKRPLEHSDTYEQSNKINGHSIFFTFIELI